MLTFVIILAEIYLATSLTALQCYVEHENARSFCQLETVKEMSKPTVELKNDSTVTYLKSGDSTRTNLTISIKKKITYDIVLEILRNFEELEQWEIPIETITGQEFPLKIIILAPVPPQMLKLQKPLQPDMTCLLEEELLECQEMNEMEIKLKSSKKKSLELEILNKQVRYPLVVELMSGTCSVVCDGAPNNCSTNVTSVIWANPIDIIEWGGLSPSFYCARILTMNECCAICTTTLEITTTENKPDPYFISKTTSLYFLGATVIIIAALIGAFLWKIGQRELKNKDSVPSTLIHEDLSKPMLEPNASDPIEILLLYPRKNNKAFVQVMNSFRKVLEMYVSKVWDPLDSRQVETVSENPFKWLESVLLIPNLKIISVQEDSNDLDQPTCLDAVYVSAMSIIHNSSEISYDYAKLFNIRFNYQPTKPTDRVPNTRYELPHHLGDLICDILGISQAHRESDSYEGDELLHFRNRLKEYTELIKKD